MRLNSVGRVSVAMAVALTALASCSKEPADVAADLPQQVQKVGEASGKKVVSIDVAADGSGYVSVESDKPATVTNYDLKTAEKRDETSTTGEKPFLPVPAGEVSVGNPAEWWAGASCGDKAYTTAMTTATGTLFVQTTCGDEITYQAIDGRKVEPLSGVFDTASIDTVLTEAKVMGGDQMMQLRLHPDSFGVTMAPVEIRGQKCFPGYGRHLKVDRSRGDGRGLGECEVRCSAGGGAGLLRG